MGALSRVGYTVELAAVFLTGSLPRSHPCALITGFGGTLSRVTFTYTEPRIGAPKIRRGQGRHRYPARGTRGE